MTVDLALYLILEKAARSFGQQANDLERPGLDVLPAVGREAHTCVLAFKIFSSPSRLRQPRSFYLRKRASRDSSAAGKLSTHPDADLPL